MWLEAVVCREDFESLAAELLPLSIRLGAEESGHYLLLDRAKQVSLVAGRGLRLSCDAQLRWPLLHVDLPIDIAGLTVLIEPSVPEGGGVLSFSSTIEHADVAILPALIDAKLASAVNEALAKRGDELSWNFAKTLTHDFSLPGLLLPLRALALEVAWGKVRTSPEAMVLAVSFHAKARRGEAGAGAKANGRANGASPPLARRPPTALAHPAPATVALATVLAMTAGYVAVRATRRFLRAVA